MNTTDFFALLLLAAASSFTPGPNTTLSAALAANHGLARALRFVCAVPVGWALIYSGCALGLGALLLAVPLLRGVLTLLGMGYLLWFALRLANSGTLAQAERQRLSVGFGQGVLLQFLNVKAWMLALAVTTGWVAGRPDAGLRFAQSLPVLVAFGFASNPAYAVLGSALRDWLAHGRRLLGFNRIMALILAATAVWLGWSMG